jgi:hypothetical protein
VVSRPVVTSTTALLGLASLVAACTATVTAPAPAGEGGSENDAASIHEELAETLAGCGMSSCGRWHTWGGPHVDDLRCLVEGLLAGEALTVQVNDGPDGAICGQLNDIYVGEDGSVFISRREDSVCDSENVIDTRDTFRCKLAADTKPLERCLAELDANDASDPYEYGIAGECWHFGAYVTACESVEQVSCPPN